MSRLRFIKKADQAIRIQLADGETLTASPPTYVNNATATAQLFDDQDAAIFPATTPVTLSYVSASSGIYRGVFTDSFDPPVGPGYYLKIVVSTPSAANRTFKRPAYVVEDE